MKPLVMSVAAVGTALCLSGCIGTSQPLIQSAGQAFGEGIDAAAKILDGQVVDAVRTERAIKAFRDAKIIDDKNPVATTLNDDFGEFACGGVKTTADQRAIVAGLREPAKIINSLAAPPSEKFDEVFASVEQYADNSKWPKLKIVESDSTTGDDKCLKMVSQAIDSLQPKPVAPSFISAIVGIQAVYDGVVKLRDDVEKIILIYYQEKDWAQRENALKSFLSDQLQPRLVQLLGKCAEYDAKVPIDNIKDVTCTGGALNDKSQGELFKRRVAGTIALPYAEYILAKKTQAAAEKKQTETEKARAATETTKVLTQVSQHLVDFDAIRLQQPPENLANSIATSFLTLRRLADGRLTDQERQKAELANLKRIAGYLKSLATLQKSVKADGAALEAAIDKLP